MCCLAKLGHVVILCVVARILLFPLQRKAPEYEKQF